MLKIAKIINYQQEKLVFNELISTIYKCMDKNWKLWFYLGIKKNHARFLGTTGSGSAGTRKNYAVKIYRFISQLRKIIYTSNESTCIETTGKPGGVV